MRKALSPIHSAACGVMVSFALFAAMVAHSGAWRPSPALSELGVTILGSLTGAFAAAAVIHNWLLKRRGYR